MADLSGSGLDPSIVSYLQGGGMPSGAPMPAPQQVSAVEYPQLPPPPPPPPQQLNATSGASGDEMPNYGLPPTVTSAIQSGFAPQSINLNVPAMQAPPPNPGADFSTSYGLHPDVVSAVQNGFQPAPNLNAPTPPQPNAGTAAPTPNAQPSFTPAQQKFAASPEGIAEQADAEKRGALAQADQANKDAMAAEIAQNDATAAALQASADRQAKQQAIDDAKNAQDQANVAKYQQQYAQQVQDAAKYNVDTDRHIGIGGLVAIALSGIGDALDHRNGPNAALQIINNGIDKRIADQWAQKRALGEQASQTKSVLDTFRQGADDDRQAQQLQRAAYQQATADQIKLIAAKTADPIAKAKYEGMAATLSGQAADITQGEATRKAAALRQQTEDAFKQQQLGLEYRAQNRADQQLAFEKQKWQDQLDAAKTAASASGNQAVAAQVDKIKNEGVFDPRTGSVMLDPQGRAKAQQADALDAAAKLSKDPAQAQQLSQQAAQLRQDAQLNNAYTIKDNDTRRAIVDNISANQGLVDKITDIADELQKGPSGFDRTKWAELKSKYESAKADYIAAHKGKVTSREMDAIQEAFSGDPNSFWDREVNTGKMQASLDALKQYAIADATRTLKGYGIQDTWTPRGESTTPVEPLSGQTTQESAEAAKPGWFWGHLMADPNKDARATLNSGTFSGLAPKDEDRVTSDIDRFEKVASATKGLQSKLAQLDSLSPSERAQVIAQAPSLSKERDDIIDRMTAYANSPRPSVSEDVIRLMRGSPELYQQVLNRLPPDRQRQLIALDAVTRAHGPLHAASPSGQPLVIAPGLGGDR